MSAYGEMDHALAGLIYGLDYEVESLIAASGVTFEFGDPVFVDEEDESIAYEPDSTDASLHFAGIAIISQRSFADSEGEYPPYDTVNVLRKGKVWVTVASGITNCAQKAAYVINLTSDADYKEFTSTSGSNYNCGCYFRSNADNGLAVLEVRGLK